MRYVRIMEDRTFGRICTVHITDDVASHSFFQWDVHQGLFPDERFMCTEDNLPDISTIEPFETNLGCDTMKIRTSSEELSRP